MDEEQTESSESTPTAPLVEGLQDQERLDSVGTFLHQVKTIFPILELKENFRATHRGLFVTEKVVKPILEQYQFWLDKQTAGEVHKSEIKCMKRLFGTITPIGQYLLEGKNCLSGFLIPFELHEPQKLGIPYYLGSLSSKKDYVHTSDPVIASLKDVQVSMQGGGIALRIKAGNSEYSISPEIFQSFMYLAQGSPRVQRDFPDLQESMAVGCKAIVKLVRKSRPANMQLLVPFAYADKNKFSFRIIGGFVFVIDKRWQVVHIYDLRGRNLYRFVRQEFARHKPRHIGSFEIYGDRHKLLGRYSHSGIQYQVTPQAFLDFYHCVHDSPDKHDHFQGNVTVHQLFERFSELFQMSQPIERHKIQAFVAHFKRPNIQFKINGFWIFAVSKQGIVEACIAKFTQRNSKR